METIDSFDDDTSSALVATKDREPRTLVAQLATRIIPTFPSARFSSERHCISHIL